MYQTCLPSTDGPCRRKNTGPHLGQRDLTPLRRRLLFLLNLPVSRFRFLVSISLATVFSGPPVPLVLPGLVSFSLLSNRTCTPHPPFLTCPVRVPNSYVSPRTGTYRVGRESSSTPGVRCGPEPEVQSQTLQLVVGGLTLSPRVYRSEREAPVRPDVSDDLCVGLQRDGRGG